jgi:hypothetical protein
VRGQAIAHLLWLAAADGRLCFGPDRDGAPTFVRTDDWVRPGPAVPRGRAPAELAIRYLRAHAPATPEDLAAWSGLGLGQARSAWWELAPRIVEVPTTEGPAWRLLRRPLGRSRPAAVRLLPAFDPLLLGWRDRRPILDPAHARRVNAGGGMLRPVVLVDGTVAATWSLERVSGGRRARIDPLRDLAAARRGIEGELRAIGTFLGEPVALDLR